MGFFSSAWSSVKDAFSDVGDALGSAVESVGDAFGDYWDSAANFLTLGLYDKVGEWIGDLFSMPTPPSPSEYLSDRKNTVRAPASSRAVVYGSARVGGQIVYLESSGADDKYLHLIVVFAAHESRRIQAIYFGDEAAATEISIGSKTYTIASEYAGLLDVHVELGDQTSVDAGMLAMIPDNWTVNHKLLGQTYVYLRLTYNKDAYNGIPRISAQVDGKNDVYDPATGVTGWTDNHAACTRDYMIWARGYNLDVADLNEASFLEGAQISNEVPATSGVKRYTVNGTFKINTRPPAILEDLLRAGAATCVNAQGSWYYIAGAYKAPDTDAYYTPDDLVGAISFAAGAPKNERVNYGKGVFISPDHNYELVDFVPIAINNYIAKDGEVLEQDYSFPFTNAGTMARRLTKIYIEKNRYGLSATITGRPYMFKHKVGDRIGLTVPSLGWSRRVFRVEAIPSFDPMAGINFRLREDVADIYDWSEGEELAVPVPAPVNLPNPYSLLPPTGLNISEAPYTDSNGVLRVKVQFSYVAGSLAASAFNVEVKLTSDTGWRRVFSNWSDTTATIFDLEPSTFDFRVQGINAIGTRSDWASITSTVDSLTSSAVTAVGLFELTNTPKDPDAIFSTVVVNVGAPADPDFDYATIEYRKSGDPSWTLIGPTDQNLAARFVTKSDGLTYQFRAFSVSVVGIRSSVSVSNSITISNTTDFEQPDIWDLIAVPPVHGLELFAQGNDSEFGGKDAKFEWRKTTISQWLPIGGEGFAGASGGNLDQYFRDYQVEVWADNKIVRTEFIFDPSYVYAFEKNAEDYRRENSESGAWREFQLRVYCRSRAGGISESPAVLDVSNTAPDPLSALSVVPGFSVIEISYLRPDDLDFAGVDIWLSETQGFDPDTTAPVATVSDNSYVVSGLTDGTLYYVRLRPFDLFGRTGTNTSAEFSVTTKTAQDLSGLSGWAYEVDPVNRTFIQDNIEGGAIDLGDPVVGGQLGTAKLADLSVEAGKLAESSVTATKIANLAVGTAAIDTAAVTNAKIANLAVGTAQIQDASIQSAKIGDAQITNAKIIDLTASKLTAGTINATETITAEGLIRSVDNINTPQYQTGIGPLTIDGTTYLMWGYNAAGAVGDKLRFGIDEIGNAYFRGDLEASSFTNTELTIDSAGNVTSTGTFRFGGVSDNFINFNGTQLEIDTDNFSVDAAGNASFSGDVVASDVRSGKTSLIDTTAGYYLDNSGSLAIGDASVSLSFDNTGLTMNGGVIKSADGKFVIDLVNKFISIEV
jgi:hypothetical protein